VGWAVIALLSLFLIIYDGKNKEQMRELIYYPAAGDIV